MGGGGDLAICPHCGFDLLRLTAVEDGPFSYEPTTGFFVDGRRLNVPPAVHELLGTILRARGTVLNRHILADRLGYEGDDSGNLIAVHLTKARRAIIALGYPFPIETRWAVGVTWNPSAAPIAHTKHIHTTPMEAA